MNNISRTNHLHATPYRFLVLIFLLWLMLQPSPAKACSPIEPLENWWYKQVYQFDDTAFPDGFSIYSRYENSALGEIGFANTSNAELRLTFARHLLPEEVALVLSDGKDAVLSGDDKFGYFRVDPGEDAFELGEWHHGPSLTPGSVENNGELPGGIPNPLPSQVPYTLIVELEDDVLVVPYTVAYHVNRGYRSNKLVHPSTIADRTVVASAIFEGIASSSNNTIEDGLILGTATFNVSRWLKGSGPLLIEVEHFGYGPDCSTPLEPDKPTIVFLGSRGSTGIHQLIYTSGWYWEALADPTTAQEIADLLDMALPTVAAIPVESTIEPEQIPVESTGLQEQIVESNEVSASSTGTELSVLVIIFLVILFFVWWISRTSKEPKQAGSA